MIFGTLTRAIMRSDAATADLVPVTIRTMRTARAGLYIFPVFLPGRQTFFSTPGPRRVSPRRVCTSESHWMSNPRNRVALP